MPKDKTVYSLHESVLLIILAALDKVYDADAIALGIPMYEVGTFITKVGEKLAQRELCSPDEATKHSAMKLVHNSKFALLKIVNGLDEEQVIESVFHIVQRCQHDYTRKRLYINVMLFDTLNQLFQDSPKRAELIKKIYDKLSELLYSDMHYWLQRAKCTYRYAKEQSALETAYTYAKKSYDDGGQDIHYKASLTLSIIVVPFLNTRKAKIRSMNADWRSGMLTKRCSRTSISRTILHCNWSWMQSKVKATAEFKWL